MPDSPVADPAAVLLDQAVLLTAARRAGRRPGRAELPPAAEPDPRPAVSQAAGLRLARILGGERQDLLVEWLAAAAARGLRPPAQLLPALLDRALHPPPGAWRLRGLAAEAGGSRARWLAGLNPRWKFLLADALTGDEAWRLGTASQRRGYLTGLRARDPAAARELIAAGWAAAGPDERVMFVQVMADGLSLADEPLLETALDDRTAWVRKMAADVLAALPGSALAERMAARARGCLRVEHGGRGPRLAVLPPDGSDPAMRRDGISVGPAGTRPRRAYDADLMIEVMARAPLGTWTRELGLTAAQIVAMPAGDWAPALFAGWSRAALAQGDREWMTALLGRALTSRTQAISAGLTALPQLARRADPRLGAPGALPFPDTEMPPGVRDLIGVLRFRYEMLKELGVEHHDG